MSLAEWNMLARTVFGAPSSAPQSWTEFAELAAQYPDNME